MLDFDFFLYERKFGRSKIIYVFLTSWKKISDQKQKCHFLPLKYDNQKEAGNLVFL